MSKAVAELDAALIAIDAQRAAAAVPPAPTAEQSAADAATLTQYLALKNANPFAAANYQRCHSGAIYRAMSRQQAEDSTGSLRAITPRRMPRIF